METLIIAGISAYVVFLGKTWMKLTLAGLMILMIAITIGFFFLVGADTAAWFVIGVAALISIKESSLFGKLTTPVVTIISVLVLAWLGSILWDGMYGDHPSFSDRIIKEQSAGYSAEEAYKRVMEQR